MNSVVVVVVVLHNNYIIINYKNNMIKTGVEEMKEIKQTIRSYTYTLTQTSQLTL